MTPITIFPGRRVAVFGLGGSGRATALALQAGGAIPVVWDDNADGVAKAREKGLTAEPLAEADWSGFAALVRAKKEGLALQPALPLSAVVRQTP